MTPARYVWLGASDAEAAAPAGVVFLHADHLGSSVLVTDTQGGVVSDEVYRPYGQRLNGGGEAPDLAFGGHRLEDGVGLYDFGARWYDPGLGLFLQPDPVAMPAAGSTMGSPYLYVGGRTTSLVDPDGRVAGHFEHVECAEGQFQGCESVGEWEFPNAGPDPSESVQSRYGIQTDGGTQITGPGATAQVYTGAGQRPSNTANGNTVVVQNRINVGGGGRRNSSTGKSQGGPSALSSTGSGNTVALDAELAKLPGPVRATLATAGVNFVAVKDSVVEHFPRLKGVRPRGYPPGATWDKVPGLFDPKSNTVVVATSGKYGHGSFNLALHETGHAYSLARGGLENSAAFRAAYGADLGALGGYYTQAGGAGRSEAFAESFARHFGGDSSFAGSLPNLSAYWTSGP